MTEATDATDVKEPALREMRWWDIEAVLALEYDLFPEDAWSPGMFWSELAHARGPAATRRYVVAETADGRIAGYAGLARRSRNSRPQRHHPPRPGPQPAHPPRHPQPHT
ncbi:hypothetical protein AB0P39_18715, partial [Streptomyces niveus]